jgi:hypothetical protein
MTVGILFLTACGSGGSSGPTTTESTVRPTGTTVSTTGTTVPTTDTTVPVGPHSGRQQAP